MGQVIVRVDPRVVLFALGGLLIVAGIAIQFILPKTPIFVEVEGDEERPKTIRQIFKGIKVILIFKIQSNFKMVFTEVPFILMLFCCYCLNFGNTLLFAVYATWFEQTFHLTADKVAILTVAIGGAELAGAGSAALFTDKVGIPRFFIITTSVCTVSYIILAFIGNLNLVAGIVAIFICCGAFESGMVALFSLVPMVAFDDTASFIAAAWLCLGLGKSRFFFEINRF